MWLGLVACLTKSSCWGRDRVYLVTTPLMATPSSLLVIESTAIRERFSCRARSVYSSASGILQHEIKLRAVDPDPHLFSLPDPSQHSICRSGSRREIFKKKETEKVHGNYY